jgi:phenylacetate-CoA ligase
MNPYLNPFFLLRITASYLSDVNRIWKFNNEQIRRYQEKSLRKMVRYAYNVPLYNKKYKENGIHPDNIKGIDDIHKLPFITKDDLRNNYPNGIIPRDFDITKSFLVSTSGSTGKPVFMYYDLFNTIKHLEGFLRALKALNENWRKTKIVQIIDLAPGTTEKAIFRDGINLFLKRFISMDNHYYFHVDSKPEDLITNLNKINPDIISSDPVILNKLANLKMDGHGKNINPKYITSSSAMLDRYTKKYVEKAFDCRVLNYYATTETGLISFECLKGKYHVNSDFVFLEVLDEEYKPVDLGKLGHVVVTKLYGGGTPIIRYTGLDDLLILNDEKCSCGINSPIISNIQGRSMDLIILPDNKTIAPFEITTIPANVMDDFNTYKISQFQIIQHKIDEIEVLIKIDEALRNKGSSVEIILDEILKKFKQKMGEKIKIKIHEVKEIPVDPKSNSIKVVVSKIKKK